MSSGSDFEKSFEDEEPWNLPPHEDEQYAWKHKRTYDRSRLAGTYMDAMRLGLAPAPVIAEVYEVSRTQAYRMIRIVADEGRLGRAPHFPARAMIHRNTGKQRTWVVCETCMTSWPCRSMKKILKEL